MNNIVRDFFDKVANNYTHDDCEFINKELASLGLDKYHHILDLGCGKGVISAELAVYSGGEVTGLDISSKMIDAAKEAVKHPRVKFIRDDFYAFVHEPFDAIICFDCYPHFLDKNGFIEKANELLNKNGMLLIIHDIGRPTLNEHHKKTAGHVSRLLKEPEIEAKDFLKYFDLIEAKETDKSYKIMLQKR